jgi:hypothetical protein
MLVENANVWGLSKYHDFLWMANQSDPLQKNKVELGMHPQLINMDLQEGTVIKDI